MCGKLDGATILEMPHRDSVFGVAAVWRCGQCGLRRLRPRPVGEQLGRYYAEAAGYNAFVGRKRSAKAQRWWDFLRDCRSQPAGVHGWAHRLSFLGGLIADWAFDINVPLNGKRGLRVLEVGSGYGDILIYLKSRGCEVLGIDLSEGAAGWPMVPKYLAIGIGMWLGTIMWFNVWFVIWPNQQKALNIGGKFSDLPADQTAAAAKTAMIFSRINTLLSVPMLFSMVAAGHLY